MDLREEIETANRRAQETQATHPRALSARYDRRIGRVVVHLSTGLDIAFCPTTRRASNTRLRLN